MESLAAVAVVFCVIVATFGAFAIGILICSWAMKRIEKSDFKPTDNTINRLIITLPHELDTETIESLKVQYKAILMAELKKRN